jgi:hypothetical protein
MLAMSMNKAPQTHKGGYVCGRDDQSFIVENGEAMIRRDHEGRIQGKQKKYRREARTERHSCAIVMILKIEACSHRLELVRAKAARMIDESEDEWSAR